MRYVGRGTWFISLTFYPLLPSHLRQPGQNVVCKGPQSSRQPLRDVKMFEVSGGIACRGSCLRDEVARAPGCAVYTRVHSSFPLPLLCMILKETKPASRREPKYQWLSGCRQDSWERFWQVPLALDLSGHWKEPDSLCLGGKQYKPKDHLHYLMETSNRISTKLGT